jgi:hypothetical protein
VDFSLRWNAPAVSIGAPAPACGTERAFPPGAGLTAGSMSRYDLDHYNLAVRPCTEVTVHGITHMPGVSSSFTSQEETLQLLRLGGAGALDHTVPAYHSGCDCVNSADCMGHLVGTVIAWLAVSQRRRPTTQGLHLPQVHAVRLRPCACHPTLSISIRSRPAL